MVTPRRETTDPMRRPPRWPGAVCFSLLTLLVCGLGFGQRGSERVTVISPAGRQFIVISEFAGVPMIPLDEIAPLVGGSIRDNGSSAEFSIDDRVATLTAGNSMVRAPGKWEVLSGPVKAGGGQWFVPLDFIKKVLPLLSQDEITYRQDEQLLVLGGEFPRVTVRSLAYPTYTRVVLESTTSIPLQVSQTGTQVQVLVQAPYIDTDFQEREIGDGVVEKMTLARLGEAYVLSVDLGKRFGELKPFELENPTRLVLDFFRSRVPTNATGLPEPPDPNLIGPPLPPVIPVNPEPDLPSPPETVAGDLRTIALDPGHGGSETGATGAGGLQEKDVALQIARRLKELLEDQLGVRVLLTRDGDRSLALDERTAFANNNKSDLFISIHVNASPRRNARGSSVYYLSYEASDEESRRVAQAENAPFAAAAVPAARDLQFILWDMAQAAYLNESANLAEILQEELVGDVADENNRGIKQAPFRVLMGATMPAVLVEVGFITNPEEEQLLRSEEFRDQLARSIFRGVLRYKERYERTLGGNDSASAQERR